jgi:hypothetical protein
VDDGSEQVNPTVEVDVMVHEVDCPVFSTARIVPSCLDAGGIPFIVPEHDDDEQLTLIEVAPLLVVTVFSPAVAATVLPEASVRGRLGDGCA